MKIQNNKIKYATTITVVLVIALGLSSSTTVIPIVNAQMQPNPISHTTIQSANGCIDKMLKNLPDLTSAQQEQAITLAEKSTELVKNVGSSSYSLVTVAPNYSFNPKTCSNVTINGVTVGFKLSNGSSLGIYEDGKISKITGAKIPHIKHGIEDSASKMPVHGSGNSTIWAGYAAYYQATSGTNSSLIYGVTNYYQPSISASTQCSNAQPYYCDLSVWGGLDNDNDYLAQTGTDAIINCQSSCGSQQNTAWYEFYSSSGNYGNFCQSSDVVNSGDQMEAVTENGQEFGGSNDQFKTFLTDSAGTGWICSSGVYTWTNAPVPNTAKTILETPGDILGTDSNYYYAALPAFTSVDNTGNQYCYGTSSCANFSTSTSNGWYYAWDMSNCSTNYDITVGSVNTNGDFTSTYKSSCGTSGRS